jgi:hypothetical protein
MQHLKHELERLAKSLTDSKVARVKSEFMKSTGSWPAAAREDVPRQLERITAESIRVHLAELIALIDDGLARGPHHFCRFMGD